MIFRLLPIAMVAVASTCLIPANAQQATVSQEKKLIEQLQKDVQAREKAAQNAQPAAVAGQARTAEPEHRRLAVLTAVKELRARVVAKRAQMEALEKQIAAEKDLGKKREMEKKLGSLHRDVGTIQTEIGNALLYNIMPNTSRAQ